MRSGHSLAVALAVSMLLACPLHAQSTWSGADNDLVFCSESLDRSTLVANETHSGGFDLWRPLWSVSAGAIILHRSTPQQGIIVENYTRTTTLLDASDFSFGWSAGADIGVTRRVDKVDAIDAIEFRYFGVQNLQANTSIITGGIWRLPHVGPFVNDSQIDTSYQSQLHSAEINVLRDSSCSRITWIAGARWIGLDERMDLMFWSLPSGSPAHFYFPTQNNLLGGQVGAAIRLWERGGPLHINCTSKAGLYGNSAANRFEILDSVGNFRVRSSDRRTQAAFVGDLGLTAVYQWTNHIALQGGYQLLWIEGAAVAGAQPESADPNTGGGLASNGGVFYHGAMASVNFTW
jgi:hypothetical protein